MTDTDFDSVATSPVLHIETPAPTTEPAPDEPHHYFASCAYGWAVAPTVDAAVAKLIRAEFSGDMLKRALKRGGAYVWTCRVHLPIEADYSINNYAPEYLPGTTTRVPKSEGQGWYVINMQGTAIPVAPDVDVINQRT